MERRAWFTYVGQRTSVLISEELLIDDLKDAIRRKLGIHQLINLSTYGNNWGNNAPIATLYKTYPDIFNPDSDASLQIEIIQPPGFVQLQDSLIIFLFLL